MKEKYYCSYRNKALCRYMFMSHCQSLWYWKFLSIRRELVPSYYTCDTPMYERIQCCCLSRYSLVCKQHLQCVTTASSVDGTPVTSRNRSSSNHQPGRHSHSPFGCFYAPADFYDRREEEEDASQHTRRRFFMVTGGFAGRAAFSISRMCISTLPFGPRVVYMSRRLSLSRWPFRRLPARWRCYGVEAVGKFVCADALTVSVDIGPPLDFDGHVLRDYDRAPPHCEALAATEIATFIFTTDRGGFKLSV